MAIVAEVAPDLTIAPIHNWGDCPQTIEMWADLAREHGSVFMDPEWQKHWWAAYGHRSRLYLLSSRHRDGGLAGIAAFQIADENGLRVLRYVGDGDEADGFDLLTRPGLESEFASAVVHWLKGNVSDWDVAELRSSVAESSRVQALISALVTREFVIQNRSRAHLVVPLPQTWQNYEQGLSAKMRERLRTNGRKLGNRLNFRRCERSDEIEPMLSELFRLHLHAWERRNVSTALSSPIARNFCVEAAQHFFCFGGLELWSMSIDGVPAAVEFACRWGSRAYSLKLGYSPAFGAFSPGYVLKARMLQHLITQGVRSYDFLSGDDEYKWHWRPEVFSFGNLRFAPQRTPMAAAILQEQRMERTKNALMAALPESLRPALRRVLRSLRG